VINCAQEFIYIIDFYLMVISGIEEFQESGDVQLISLDDRNNPIPAQLQRLSMFPRTVTHNRATLLNTDKMSELKNSGNRILRQTCYWKSSPHDDAAFSEMPKVQKQHQAGPLLIPDSPKLTPDILIGSKYILRLKPKILDTRKAPREPPTKICNRADVRQHTLI
jgi:hypothetical protein